MRERQRTQLLIKSIKKIPIAVYTMGIIGELNMLNTHTMNKYKFLSLTHHNFNIALLSALVFSLA